jgi:tetratricopeptide (TPR) repeat protein
MPSLQALADFKTSFRSIGNEVPSLAEQNLSVDDLPLPDNEPEPLPVSGVSAASSPPATDAENTGEVPGLDDGEADYAENPGDMGLSEPNMFDLGDLLNSSGEEGQSSLPDFDDMVPAGAAGTGLSSGAGDQAAASPDAGDFDFSDFLDTIPDDIPGEEAQGDKGEDDLDFPQDLLAGFADEVEAGRAPGNSGESEALPDFSTEDVDFSDLGEDFSSGSEADTDLPENLENFTFPEFGDDEGSLSPDDESGGSGEKAPETAPAGDEGAEDIFPLFSEESAEETGSPAEPFPEQDFSLPPIEELPALPEDEAEALPGEAPAGEGLGADNFSAPKEELDPFEGFNLDGDASSVDFNTETEPASNAAPGADLAGLEEFSLPGIDDVLNKAVSADTKSAAAPEKAVEVEEIRLNDADLVRLQQTLASYPLNLRIACEELIAEQTVTPDLMSKLIKLLVRGAAPREAASLAEKILGRTIAVPRGFEKKTGEALEEEQASFVYIFSRKFLPILGLFLAVALVMVSLFYLIHQFIYTPLRAESIYRLGYERIASGDYARANERFSEAFRVHRVKDWFYRYAEAFREARQYMYAEEKYDELLRYYPRDKKAVLDYANMETYYLRNYDKADSLLRRNILDYAVDDPEALLALGDNSLAWGETDPEKYEDARASYARLLERYGWTDSVVERMMKYFIRTDNLGEVLPLQRHFTDNPKRNISPSTLAELGGYLLDKRFEETRGVPNAYVEQIEGIRDILLRAVAADPALPESHYHLVRYYHHFGNTEDERITVETAARAFDAAREESIKRVQYRIDTQRRYAEILTENRSFIGAEEQLVKGIEIYENAVSRRLFPRAPEFGRLYADLGDLEYFTQSGNTDLALENYLLAERNGWAPPEIQYRIGAAHYQERQWTAALERFFVVASEIPFNRRILYALGNVSYMRGNYFAAQGYYNRLLDVLETERARFPLLQPNEYTAQAELAERLMVAQNNMGVILEALTEHTGDNRYRSRALGFYTESARAWDVLTRNPDTMLRMRPAPDLSAPGINPAYLNVQNSIRPLPDYEPWFFRTIDKDVLEPSNWERLAPADERRRLAEGVFGDR